MLRSVLFSAVFAVLMMPCLACAEKSPEYTSVDQMSPADAADFKVQGEYAGDVQHEGESVKVGVQVRALGKGKFLLVAYRGGLPGAGWQRGDWSKSLEMTTTDGVVSGETESGARKAEIKDGKCFLYEDGKKIAELEKVTRKSPTLGAKAPEGAVVLFDGTTADNFKNGNMPEEGLLGVGVVSKEEFGDHKLHLEFRTPFTPEARGQHCGNSGCYVFGRYEVQILDSFGLEGKDNECGGVYQAAPPKVNMALPSLAWQTYDIDFTAPKFDESGKKTEDARMTVKHNGVVIHDDIKVPMTPGGVSGEEAPKGPLFLQNHTNPVRFRNIWVVPKQ